MNAEWERIENKLITAGVMALTHRMPVPGGWLYRTTTSAIGADCISVAMVFVSDPNGGDRALQKRELACKLEAIATVLEQRIRGAGHET